MDGAIRFTQRDALAAVLITGVNIIAGLIIGVFQHGLDLGDRGADLHDPDRGRRSGHRDPGAARLDVGRSDHDARGVGIEPRRRSRGPVARRVRGRWRSRRRSLAGLALIPGLPKLSFLIVATLLGGAALRDAAEAGGRGGADDGDHAEPMPSDSPAPVDPLSVEIGYALVALADEKQGGTLLNRVRAIRKQIAAETGVVVPPVHVADNLQLGPRTYSILVKGVEVARGELVPDRLMAINPGTASSPLEGSATREPAFGLPAWWIPTSQREHASAAGYTVVDADDGAVDAPVGDDSRRSCRICSVVSRPRSSSIASRQTSPKLVEELVPKVVSVGEIQRVLRQLLRERVPIRDLTTILESIADAAQTSKDPDAITEAVRTAMGRTICRQYQTERGELPAISFAPALEAKLMSSIVRTDQGAVLALEPTQAQQSGVADRRRASRSIGTACALVHADASPSSVAAVRASAATYWRAFAQRDSAAVEDCDRRRFGLTCS